MPRMRLIISSVLLLLLAVPVLKANDDIPKAAWKRPLGAELQDPGRKNQTWNLSIWMTATGRARLLVVLGPARFPEVTAGTLSAGT